MSESLKVGEASALLLLSSTFIRVKVPRGGTFAVVVASGGFLPVKSSSLKPSTS